MVLGFPGGSVIRNSLVSAGDARDVGSIPGLQPAPVFLPGKFHGQRSLEGYSTWGGKESDMTEQLSTYAHRVQKGLGIKANQAQRWGGTSRITVVRGWL